MDQVTSYAASFIRFETIDPTTITSNTNAYMSQAEAAGWAQKPQLPASEVRVLLPSKHSGCQLL